MLLVTADFAEVYGHEVKEVLEMRQPEVTMCCYFRWPGKTCWQKNVTSLQFEVLNEQIYSSAGLLWQQTVSSNPFSHHTACSKFNRGERFLSQGVVWRQVAFYF